MNMPLNSTQIARQNARRRALYAVQAVALGGVFNAACNDSRSETEQPEPDATVDAVQPDAQADVAADTVTDSTEPDAIEPDAIEPDATEPDVFVDIGMDSTEPDVIDVDTTPPPDIHEDAVGCSDERDDICPVDCTWDTDYDCCAQSAGSQDGNIPDWCEYVPGEYCSCIAVGPFNPPEAA